MPAYLRSFGHALPERVVTSAELATHLGKTAEWIEKASGIRERRWAGAGQSAVDLAVSAAEDCLQRAGFDAAEVGMLILSSGSEAAGFPGPAAEVAQRLGLETAPAIDVPIASAGSLFGLAMAAQWTPKYSHVLVVAAEKMSAIVAPETGEPNPNTAILFGDGAGAALVSQEPGSGPSWQVVDAVLHSDGQFRDALTYRPSSGLQPGSGFQMDGLSVIMQAVRKLPKVISEVLEKNGRSAAEIGTFLVHQANLNLLERVGKSLGVDSDKVYVNVDRYGNTSSASLLIAASEWSRQASSSAPIVLASFGAGFHWGALLADPTA